MKTFLFLDTETTGFKKNGTLIQEGQARVCQLAMILTDETGKHISEFSTLIKPDGWQVSQFNIDSCGITQEMCEKFGISYKWAYQMFLDWHGKADVTIAHNVGFDCPMMQIEGAYCEMSWIEKVWYCTMDTNKHISGGKWPKLSHALKHFCNRELGNKAHNAMHDVLACKDIFFASRRS